MWRKCHENWNNKEIMILKYFQFYNIDMNMLEGFFKKSSMGLNYFWWQNFHHRKNIDAILTSMGCEKNTWKTHMLLKKNMKCFDLFMFQTKSE